MAATLVAAYAAYDKAQSSFKHNPPAPEFDQVVCWILSGSDVVASGSAALTGLMAGYAIYQIFKPDPATKTDVKDDSRKTREGIEHISKQVVAEGQASDLGHGLTQRLLSGALYDRVEAAIENNLWNEEQQARIYAKLSEKLGVQGAQEATNNIVGAAARSNAEVQQLLAEGKFAEAGTAQKKRAEAGDAKQAQLWRDTARIKVLTSIAEAIAAYARAVDLDPTDFATRIELSRLHRAAGTLPEAQEAAEAALQHVEDRYDQMVAEGELGKIAVLENKFSVATQHYTSALHISQALSAAEPDNLNLQRQVGVSHNQLGFVDKGYPQVD